MSGPLQHADSLSFRSILMEMCSGLLPCSKRKKTQLSKHWAYIYQEPLWWQHLCFLNKLLIYQNRESIFILFYFLYGCLSESSSEVTEPITGSHLSQIWFDKAQSCRVRPQLETCVSGREGWAVPSARMNSPVWATNPNEAALRGGEPAPSLGICFEEPHNQGQ